MRQHASLSVGGHGAARQQRPSIAGTAAVRLSSQHAVNYVIGLDGVEKFVSTPELQSKDSIGAACTARRSTSPPCWPDKNSESTKSTTASGSSASCITISATSTWSRRPCNPSTTRSARGCHPCLRYNLSPMCPEWTRKDWRRGRDSNPRYGCPYAAFRVRCIQPLCHLSAGPGRRDRGDDRFLAKRPWPNKACRGPQPFSGSFS
jgi:hypothetical protein